MKRTLLRGWMLAILAAVALAAHDRATDAGSGWDYLDDDDAFVWSDPEPPAPKDAVC